LTAGPLCILTLMMDYRRRGGSSTTHGIEHQVIPKPSRFDRSGEGAKLV